MAIIKRILERRRRKGKTDYAARLAFLKSGEKRLVIRKTNKHLMVHIVETKKLIDYTLIAINSKELEKEGIKSTNNVVSAYLVGYLIGKKAIKQNIKKLILDLGLQTSTKGSKLYAVVKGAIDAGIEIPCDKKMFPSQERIDGKHLKEEKTKIINEIKNKLK